MKQLKCNIPSQILRFTPMISMTLHEYFPKRKKPFLKATEIPKPKKIQFCKQKSCFTSILTHTLQKNKKIFINTLSESH